LEVEVNVDGRIHPSTGSWGLTTNVAKLEVNLDDDSID
jgi:hypothetical protein